MWDKMKTTAHRAPRRVLKMPLRSGAIEVRPLLLFGWHFFSGMNEFAVNAGVERQQTVWGSTIAGRCWMLQHTLRRFVFHTIFVLTKVDWALWDAPSASSVYNDAYEHDHQMTYEPVVTVAENKGRRRRSYKGLIVQQRPDRTAHTGGTSEQQVQLIQRESAYDVWESRHWRYVSEFA